MARYLEISFRQGKPLAAYLYLNADAERIAARSEERGPGLIVDFGPDGRAIGIEITSPTTFSVWALNTVLAGLGESPASPEDVSPLAAA